MYDSEKAKQYRNRYKESTAAYNREYRETNPGLDKKYYRWNPERRKEINKELRRRNPIRSLLYLAKSRAKKNNILFDVTWEDVEKVTHCPILGVELEYLTEGCATDNTASLDRVIPSLGYVKGNVRIISKRANTIKNDASVEELEAVIRYIKEHTNE